MRLATTFLIGLILCQCRPRPYHKESKEGLCYPRMEGVNLAVDGGFEQHLLGELESPWMRRPFDSIANFTVVEKSSYQGEKHLVVNAQSGDWWGIAYQTRLKPGKKYIASFLMKGDSAEIHCGATNSGIFLGWDNAHVPYNEWQLVSFDFYMRDSAAANTTIYIYGKNDTEAFQLRIDDLQVIQERPDVP